MLARIVPAPLVRWFARPYVAGDSMDAGLDVARRVFAERGLFTTLDVLGEDVTTAAQLQANVALYGRLIDALAAQWDSTAERPSISLKPSAFTIGAETEAQGPVTDLVQRAHSQGVAVTIDMEDHDWTDLTIDWSVGLFESGCDVGTVLQTRLHRTEADLARIPAGMRLRLVIGIYPEPADIALTEKPAMKERMLDYAAQLLERDVSVEFATHDVPTIERFAAEVALRKPECCEVQMLLGVPRARLQQRLREQGIHVRLYVPFANGWNDATAYLRRRMRESPSTMWLVFRNVFAGRADR